MENLINSMTNEDPAKRPRIEEVLQTFARIRRSLSKAKLRSAIISRKAPKVFVVVQRAMHSIRTMKYILSRLPSIPDPYTPAKPRERMLSKSKGRL